MPERCPLARGNAPGSRGIQRLEMRASWLRMTAMAVAGMALAGCAGATPRYDYAGELHAVGNPPGFRDYFGLAPFAG